MAQPLSLEEIGTRITGWFAGKLPGGQDISLSGLEKPSVGLSNETYSLTLRWNEAGAGRQRKLVMDFFW